MRDRARGVGKAAPPIDITELTVEGVQAGFASGAFTAEALTRACTVSEINIAGIPGVVVPAGYYKSGAPFCLIIVGRMWSEGDLLAYAYEQATKHRRPPVLRQA